MKVTPLRAGTKQMLLTFPAFDRHRSSTNATGSIYRLQTGPLQHAFLPLGLFLWGAQKDTYFCGIQSGPQYEGDTHQGKIPGAFFASQYTFEGLQALAEKGELELAVADRQLLEMTELLPGQVVTLRIEGPYDGVCVWGLGYTRGQPALKATIGVCEKTSQHYVCTYEGQLIEQRLRGDHVVVEVTAPSEESVCRLLASLHCGDGRL